jgi:hypothetical protein
MKKALQIIATVAFSVLLVVGVASAGIMNPSGGDTSGFLTAANNLSDVANAATSRTSLGLGTAATRADAFFAQVSNNLSDLANAATARTNLGLGTAATRADAFFAQAANNLSDLANATTARTNLGLGTIATKATPAAGVVTSDGTNLSNVAPGSSGNILTSNGSAWTSAAAAGAGIKLHTVANDVSLSASTAETDLFTVSVPGGTLGTANAIYGRMHINSLAGVSGTFTFRIKYGAATLNTFPITLVSTYETGVYEFVLYGDGSTSAQELSDKWLTTREFGGSMGSALTGTHITTGSATAAIDSTSAQTLKATGQFSVSNGSNAITVSDVVIYKLN